MLCRLPQRHGGVAPTPSTYRVKIAGTLNASYAYARINGTKYSSANSTGIEVESGSKITIYVSTNGGTTYQSYCGITVDGKTVQSGAGSYSHTVTKDCTLTFSRQQVGYAYAYRCAVT